MGGQVVRGTDGAHEPLANQWVVLHRVNMESGAPVDSVRTDRAGRYRFRVTWDTTSIYFMGTDWQDIAYLTQPIEGRTPMDTAETLVVWDTTRVGVPLTVAQRHFIIRLPEASTGRRVLEFLVLQNREHATRVGTGPSGPTWSGRLPTGAFQFEMGESDVSAEAVRSAEGSVQVMAPVPPGERQLLYTYVLPGGDRTLDITLDHPVERVTVLLEDTAATLVSGPLTDRGIEVFEDAPFRIFDGTVTEPGTSISVRFTVGRGLSEGTMAGLLVMGVVILVTIVVIIRRRALAPEPPTP